MSSKYNQTTTIRIRHQSVPKYLDAIRVKVREFGKEALFPFSEPKRLVLGFQCKDEIHLIGLNNIRAYYNIERILPNIPGLVSWRRNQAPTVSQDTGIEMFANDCKEAMNEPFQV